VSGLHQKIGRGVEDLLAQVLTGTPRGTSAFERLDGHLDEFPLTVAMVRSGSGASSSAPDSLIPIRR
jgi:hypothetical protein